MSVVLLVLVVPLGVGAAASEVEGVEEEEGVEEKVVGMVVELSLPTPAVLSSLRHYWREGREEKDKCFVQCHSHTLSAYLTVYINSAISSMAYLVSRNSTNNEPHATHLGFYIKKVATILILTHDNTYVIINIRSCMLVVLI